MAEINPPLYVPVSLAYGSDELGLPFRDLIGEGVVAIGDLAVTQRAAGVNKSVDVAAGACWVKGDDDTAAQPTYRARSSSVVNLAIAANASGNPRVDQIVAHVKDATFSGALNSWALEVVAGAPTAGATLANGLGMGAVPNNAIVLARVLAANGFASISNAEISDVRARALVGGGVANVKAGATVATKISELPAATDGMIARLRLMPTTFNNGGATGLPAATITVGDTTDFPTAGTVETPNGTVAYTGKTATTLTGCTGGTGTLAANAVIRLLTGTPPSGSYDTIVLYYDAVMGKWVSANTAFADLIAAGGTFIAALNTWTDMPTFVNGTQTGGIGISWRALDAAGLKPQVRYGGGSAKNTANVYATFNLRPAFLSAAKRATALTAISGDANAANAPGTEDTTERALEGTPWGSIGAYTLADIFWPGIQVMITAGTVGTGNHSIRGTLETRWVG